MKKLAFLSIGLGLFILGYLGRGFWERDRAVAYLGLFEEYCVSQNMGKEFQPGDNIVEMPNLGSGVWANRDHTLLLRTEGRHCSVSDILRPFSKNERKKLDERVSHLVAQNFSDLQFDPRARLEGADSYSAWMFGEPQAPDRWGVFIYRQNAEGEDSHTRLSIFMKKSM